MSVWSQLMPAAAKRCAYKSSSKLIAWVLLMLLSAQPAWSAIVNHSGAITTQTTWSAADVHRVTGSVTVAAGVVLTIEPGAVVKFNTNTFLRIDGGLNANGTVSDPITFTSYRDDTVGGDTDGGGFSVGQPGDWYYLFFTSTATPSQTVINFIDVRFGGGSNQGALLPYADVTLDNVTVRNSSSSGVYNNASSFLMSNCSVHDNAIDGFNLRGNGQPEIRDCQIADNGQNGIRVLSSNTSPVIVGNTISGSGNWGVFYDSGASLSPPIVGNTIRDNRLLAVLPPRAVPQAVDNNVLGPNSRNALWIRGTSNDRLTDLQLSVQSSADGVPAVDAYELRTYVITGGGLEMGSGTTLTVDPGVVVKFSGTNAYIQTVGTVSALGTAAQPIVFTSYADDAYGGDTNANGAASQPSPGDWQYFLFNGAPDGVSVFEHVLMRYGGSSTGMLYSSNTNLTVRDSQLAFSATRGLYSTSASHTLTDNEVFGNRLEGLYFTGTSTQTVSGGRVFANLDDGIELTTSSVSGTFTDLEVFANAGAGLRSASSQSIDASGNWWGAADGPSGDGAGSGDQVLDTGGAGSITITDFLTDGTEFSYVDAGGSDFAGFGIALPFISGEASTEWGTGPAQSVQFDFAGSLQVEYTGLTDGVPYELFVTYLNRDPGGSTQTMQTDTGQLVHGPIALPTSQPSIYRLPIAPDLITGGVLNLRIDAVSGLRAVVSAVQLQRVELVDNQPPMVAITAPANGALLSGGNQQIVGTASDAGSGRCVHPPLSIL